jgi:hypothetical protein
MEMVIVTAVVAFVSLKLYLKNLKYERRYRNKIGEIKSEIIEIKNKKQISESKRGSDTVDCKNIFKISNKVLKLQQKIINKQ